MWLCLDCRKEGGEHPILGWSYLPPSLIFAWKLGLLGRLSVQGETLSPSSQTALLQGSWFFLAASSSSSQSLLCKQPAASCTCTPASQPTPPSRDPSTHPNLNSGARVLALA